MDKYGREWIQAQVTPEFKQRVNVYMAMKGIENRAEFMRLCFEEYLDRHATESGIPLEDESECLPM